MKKIFRKSAFLLVASLLAFIQVEARIPVHFGEVTAGLVKDGADGRLHANSPAPNTGNVKRKAYQASTTTVVVTLSTTVERTQETAVPQSGGVSGNATEKANPGKGNVTTTLKATYMETVRASEIAGTSETARATATDTGTSEAVESSATTATTGTSGTAIVTACEKTVTVTSTGTVPGVAVEKTVTVTTIQTAPVVAIEKTVTRTKTEVGLGGIAEVTAPGVLSFVTTTVFATGPIPTVTVTPLADTVTQSVTITAPCNIAIISPTVTVSEDSASTKAAESTILTLIPIPTPTATNPLASASSLEVISASVTAPGAVASTVEPAVSSSATLQSTYTLPVIVTIPASVTNIPVPQNTPAPVFTVDQSMISTGIGSISLVGVAAVPTTLETRVSSPSALAIPSSAYVMAPVPASESAIVPTYVGVSSASSAPLTVTAASHTESSMSTSVSSSSLSTTSALAPVPTPAPVIGPPLRIVTSGSVYTTDASLISTGMGMMVIGGGPTTATTEVAPTPTAAEALDLGTMATTAPIMGKPAPIPPQIEISTYSLTSVLILGNLKAEPTARK